MLIRALSPCFAKLAETGDVAGSIGGVSWVAQDCPSAPYLHIPHDSVDVAERA
jgi:hypothetical protein